MYILHLDLGQEMRGGQWQVYYLIKEQALNGGFTPVLAAPKKSPLLAKVKNLGVETIALHSNKQWNIFSIARLFCLHRRKHFAIIHTHDARSASLGAMCSTFWKSTKLVHTRRVSYPIRARALKKYKKAHSLVAVSQDIANLMEASGLDAQKIKAIHSGIELSRYSPKTIREDKRFIFVMVGAFTPQKGHSVLINALPILKEAKNLPEWEVRLIGHGPLFNKTLETAENLEVEEHLALLGLQEASALLQHCDAMIVPSVEGEGSSGTIKEAWAVGLPLICSNLAANLELAVHNKNALVFESGNEADLAAKMQQLMKDASLQKHLVEEGKKDVQNVTAQKMASAYLEVYNDILESTEITQE